MSKADSRTPICKSGGERADALHDFAQKARAVLEAAAIASFARVRAQKFVAEIAVAVFDVHEIEAEAPGHARRAMEVLDDRARSRRRSAADNRRQIPAPVQNRMVIENSRLRAVVRVGTAVAAGVRELQPDQQAVVGAGGQRCSSIKTSSQMWPSLRSVCGRDHELIGIGAPFVRTATASPPQINFAPLWPKRCQRRIVFSLGLPSAVPSHPSIGCTAMRLPILIAPRTSGRAAAIVPRSDLGSHGMAKLSDCRCS